MPGHPERPFRRKVQSRISGQYKAAADQALDDNKYERTGRRHHSEPRRLCLVLVPAPNRPYEQDNYQDARYRAGYAMRKLDDGFELGGRRNDLAAACQPMLSAAIAGF